jgi:predicted ATP-dependent serine protease
VVELAEAPMPKTADLFFDVDGFRLLRRHPNLVFSPGGGAKSYLALYLASRLAQAGEQILYLDTEADIATHRLRLRRLFGEKRIYGLLYHRAYQPLAEAVDGLRRLIADRRITFVVVDSVSCAADGPLEESATATRLFQALRRFNCGSLLLAHTQKGGEARYRAR